MSEENFDSKIDAVDFFFRLCMALFAGWALYGLLLLGRMILESLGVKW